MCRQGFVSFTHVGEQVVCEAVKCDIKKVYLRNVYFLLKTLNYVERHAHRYGHLFKCLSANGYCGRETESDFCGMIKEKKNCNVVRLTL